MRINRQYALHYSLEQSNYSPNAINISPQLYGIHMHVCCTTIQGRANDIYRMHLHTQAHYTDTFTLLFYRHSDPISLRSAQVMQGFCIVTP